MRTVLLATALLLATACRGDGQPGVRLAIDTASLPDFSADSAHALLRAQVAFGPRAPGWPGHAAQLEWMTRFLRERADTVTLQHFDHEPSNGNPTLRMTNVFAQFRPELTTRVLLVAHWDTRPTADMDRDRRNEPIPGANDGASGTAVLLEMANVLSRHSAPIGVDLLFVDGEDYGPGEADMYLGAKHFASNQPPGYSPLYGILVDMVGDTDPRFPIEGYSRDRAPEVVDRVWRTAEQLGLGQVFPRRSGGYVMDDHLPLNDGGIRTINIIDFDYPHWHKHSDSVENTSPLGLGYVGRVLVALVFSGG